MLRSCSLVIYKSFTSWCWRRKRCVYILNDKFRMNFIWNLTGSTCYRLCQYVLIELASFLYASSIRWICTICGVLHFSLSNLILVPGVFLHRFFSTPLVLWNLYFLQSLPLFLGRMPETNTHTFLFFICSPEAGQINPLAMSLDLSCSMLFAPQIINMFSTYFQIPDSFSQILSPLYLQLRLVVQSGCTTYLDIARTCVQSHLL